MFGHLYNLQSNLLRLDEHTPTPYVVKPCFERSPQKMEHDGELSSVTVSGPLGSHWSPGSRLYGVPAKWPCSQPRPGELIPSPLHHSTTEFQVTFVLC